MNFLAHCYLSGNDPNILLGNFIADSIKGEDYKLYPTEIKNGILLHRFIDFFTDNHPLIKKSLYHLRPELGKFSGIALDIYLDHFLAKNWEAYHPESLKNFIDNVLQVTANNIEWLPEKSKRFYHYAKNSNCIFSYQYFNGIIEVFNGMSKRAPKPNNLLDAPNVLLRNYNLIEKTFLEYFPILITETQKELIKIKAR